MESVTDAAAGRPRVLVLGPDVPGGMSSSIRALLASPLAQRYRMEFVPTHLGAFGPGRRLTVFGAALLRLTLWSLRGRGRIVHVHGTKRGSLLRKAVCVLLAKALRRRVVLHLHSGPGDIATFRAELGPTRVAVLRAAIRAADLVIAVSGASALALERAFGVSGLRVIPNAAPPIPAAGPARTAAAPAVYLGGFANPVKGGEVMLEALARIDLGDARLVLAGPGELPEVGRRFLDSRPRIEWRGWLEAGDRDELLRTARIFVLPSTSEGLPMALLEAMAFGLAIVATAVGGVPEVVRTGEQALLVPPGDAAALSAALGRLLTDPALCARLGGAARERARELGPAAAADQWDAVYRSLLGSNGAL